MSEIKTPEQAIDWCNKQLKSCAGSDRNFYYSLIDDLDDLDNQVEKLMAENSGLREQIHNVKSEDD